MAKQAYFNPRRKDAFFDKVLLEVPSTNLFNLSFDNKLSFNMGDLVPLVCQEVYPGDKINISAEQIIKLAPLVTPVMHRCNVDLHAFFVPNRLLWDNFEEFQAYDSLNEIPEHPFIDAGQIDNVGNDYAIKIGSPADYLGVPTTDSDLSLFDTEHPLRNLNALPFSGYLKIWNDYFRDQNLQPDELSYKLVDGLNSFQGSVPDPNIGINPFSSKLLKRAWERDYFTSCLPFAQKGQEVVLPLGTTAPVIYDALGETVLRDQAGNIIDIVDSSGEMYWDEATQRIHVDDVAGGTDPEAHIDNSQNLLVDLSDAASASINDLRLSIRMQEFFERNARLGTRYIEQMWGKFGVRISDSRAHRAEFLGSTRSAISFSEVLQTSQTETTPLGQQAGHGMAINQDHLCNHFVEEHGFIFVLCSVLPETAYQQGLNKKFYKKDVLDYMDPMFQNLGEQEVKSWELFADDNTTFNETFGYQSRYAELKYNSNEVHGEFRTLQSDWHMGRIFNTPPTLNLDFVSSDPTHRIFADTDVNARKLYAWFHFNISAQRKLAFYSSPKLSQI